ELLLRLHERRARQHQNRVLLRQAARHLDVVLIGEAGPDRHRHRLAMPQGEDDEVAAELAAGSPAAPSPAPAVSTPPLPPARSPRSRRRAACAARRWAPPARPGAAPCGP